MEEGRFLVKGGKGALADFRLDGKVAVVTGAGSGIGQAIAVCFAAHGATIRVLDLNETAAKGTCEKIKSAGGEASFHVCDVTSQTTASAAFAELFRLGHVDILVNNAGVSHIGTVESTSEEDFDRLLRVNVKGYYNCMHAMVPHMREKGGGIILNVASIAGSVGLPDRLRIP